MCSDGNRDSFQSLQSVYRASEYVAAIKQNKSIVVIFLSIGGSIVADKHVPITQQNGSYIKS